MTTTDRALARGELTIIRPFTRSDVDEWSRWPRHPDPLFQDYNSPQLSPVEADLWYDERLARRDHAMYAIEADGALIGRLFLRHIDRHEGTSVLGIDLRSDMLGGGYGTDALRAFLRYYFGELGFRALKLDVAGYNFRAQRVYEKLGWERTGEHWTSWPSIFLPNVYEDPALEAARPFVRTSPGTISVRHFDMVLTRERWLARSGE